MRRSTTNPLMLLASLAATTCLNTAQAQYLGRASDIMPPSQVMGCGPDCEPKMTTYGWHQENWRRWPEGPIMEAIDPQLTPFAVPDRSGPKIDVPSKLDEAGANRRRRADDPAAAAPNAAAPPADAGTAGENALPSTDAAAPQTDLPNLPDAGAAREPLPSSGAADDLPKLEEEDSTGGFFPAEESAPAPSTDPAPPAESPGATEPGADDLDDLPGFSQLEDRRARRYLNERERGYRQVQDERSAARTRSTKTARAIAIDDEEEAFEDVEPARPTRRRTQVSRASHAESTGRRSNSKRSVTPVEFLEDEASDENDEAFEEDLAADYEEVDEDFVETQRPSRSSRSPSGQGKSSRSSRSTKLSTSSGRSSGSTRGPSGRVNPLRTN